MARMTKQEKLDWDELYQYVKKEILNYPDEKSLSKTMVLRLRGLRQGKFIANNKVQSNGDYSYKIILLTFKINKLNIINALGDKSKFKSEIHMINYIMTIIENHINDTFDIVKNKEKSEELVQSVEIHRNDIKKHYISKTKETTNSRLKHLW